MRHRRTAEQLKQTILNTEKAIQTGTARTVKEACKMNKIKPSQFYDKRKQLPRTKMVNNVEQKVRNIKSSFEETVIDRVADKIASRLIDKMLKG